MATAAEGHMRTFDEARLREFDGRSGGPIYLAIKGVVFDVSSVPESRALYGPEGPYHVFAGRECARALAVMRVAREECNDRLEDLDPTALQTLEEWITKFKAKYPIVGQVQKKKRRLRRLLPIFSGLALVAAGIVVHRLERGKAGH